MKNDDFYADALKRNFPYTALYIQKYGKKNVVSTYEIPSIYEKSEEFYKKCIEKGKQARDIIDIPKNVIL